MAQERELQCIARPGDGLGPEDRLISHQKCRLSSLPHVGRAIFHAFSGQNRPETGEWLPCTPCLTFTPHKCARLLSNEKHAILLVPHRARDGHKPSFKTE
jgi:hypothetical protein